MDVSGKDFSLKFRGFEHDDPETVQRFTAFCEANFALSPETVRLLQDSPETIVLTHGGSVEELEALAKVLREIGAVVDVSSDGSDELSSLVGGPSTQELHRLFRGQSASENDDTLNYCPYPPPLGRSLYLLSNSDAVVDRRALRQRARQGTSTEISAIGSATPSTRSLAMTRWGALALGIVALFAATLLLKKEGALPHSSPSLAPQSIQRAESVRREAPRVESGPTKTISGTTSYDRFAVDMKVLASPSAVSVSSLTFALTGRDTAPNGILVRRIVGEPTFLKEAPDGRWVGQIILSVFVEENGTSSHFTVPASVMVSIDASRSVSKASIQVANNHLSDLGVAVSKESGTTYTLSGMPFVEIPLS